MQLVVNYLFFVDFKNVLLSWFKYQVSRSLAGKHQDWYGLKKVILKCQKLFKISRSTGFKCLEYHSVQSENS